MKKEYIKPTMQVVKIQQQCQMLAGSVGARSLTNGDGFSLDENGIPDNVLDM
jgi:hypothetical protein